MGYEDGSWPPKGALFVRSGDGQEKLLCPEVMVYLWDSNGVREACTDALPIIKRARIGGIVPHSGTADLLRGLEPGLLAIKNGLSAKHWADLRIQVGVGIDGTIEAYRKGKLTAEQVINRYGEVAKKIQQLSQAMRIEAIVLNGESKWALQAGDLRSTQDMKNLAYNLGKKIRELAPDLVIGLSSFGALGYHADVRALIEGLTPHCSFFTGQSYAATSGEIKSGAIDYVVERDLKSQQAVEKQGWFRPDSSDELDCDTSPDDLDRVPTFQGYKQHIGRMVRYFSRWPLCYVWSLPVLGKGGRFDDSGITALIVSMLIRSKCGWGKEAVKQFQASRGLVADNDAGPKTIAAAKADFDAKPWY